MTEAHTLLDERRYEDALRQAQLKLWSGELTAAETVDAYHVMGRAQLWTEQYFAAVHSLTTARVQATSVDHPDLPHIELNLGAAYLWLGDLHEAKQALNNALIRPSLTVTHQGLATYNLGLIEEIGGHFQNAIGYFFVARDLLRIANRPDRVRACTLEITWCYLLQKDAEQAHPFLCELEQELNTKPSPVLEELISPHWALYYQLQGDLGTSMQQCERAMTATHLDKRDYHNTVGEAAWIAGTNALALDRLEEARMFAQQAMNHGLQLQWPSLVNRAHKLRLSAQRSAKER